MALPTLLKITDLSTLRGNDDDDDGELSAQRVWRLVFAERVTSHEDLELIRTYAGTGARGDVYKTGDSRVLVKKSVRCLDETQSEFLVFADYKVPDATGTYNANPTSRPDEIGGDFAPELRPYFKDANGDESKNTAGSIMKPLPRRYEGVFTIRVQGNRAVDSTRPGAWAQYTKPACSYNAGTVTIRGYTFGAKKLLLMRATWKLVKENQYTFEQWTWDLGINPEGWDVGDYIPSRGWRDVDGPILKGEVPEVVDDWPLDSSGVRAATANYPPYEINRKPYFSRDFSVFGFTASL
jgi:hypothetical protein